MIKLNELFLRLIDLPNSLKLLIIIFVDVLIIFFSLIFSFSLRLSEIYIPSGDTLYLVLISPLIAVPTLYFFGVYKSIIRYIGLNTIVEITKAIALYSAIWGSLIYLTNINGIPRSISLINFIISLASIISIRFLARSTLTKSVTSINNKDHYLSQNNFAIYGAGKTGNLVLNSLSDYSYDSSPKFFIDDDKRLKGKSINGIQVFSPINISKVILKYNVKDIIIAIPSLSKSKRQNIVDLLSKYKVVIRILPGNLEEILKGKIKISDLKEISIEDLLGRSSVMPFENLLQKNIKDKVVMVTGAGGSIGSELARQIILQNPSKIVLLDNSEYSLYNILENLKRDFKEFPTENIIPILGSIVNRRFIQKVFKYFKIETIYHAAAYKHVPIVEMNVFESVYNNIFGTYELIKAAVEFKVKNFVLVSTDKAVRPTNIMGATKRISEIILQAFSNKELKYGSSIKYCIVRFGNVLGSSGSVIPLFKNQIETGGPITVTHPEIIRYFMTIPESAQLVIQAGAMCQGSEIFLLDMGIPIRIDDLAKKMINLSGLELKNEQNKFGDIEIVYSGLRPGEKLYEELTIGDNVSSTKHKMIFKTNEESVELDVIEKVLDELKELIAQNDIQKLHLILKKYVEDFKPYDELVDNFHTKVLK